MRLRQQIIQLAICFALHDTTKCNFRSQSQLKANIFFMSIFAAIDKSVSEQLRWAMLKSSQIEWEMKSHCASFSIAFSKAALTCIFYHDKIELASSSTSRAALTRKNFFKTLSSHLTFHRSPLWNAFCFHVELLKLASHFNSIWFVLQILSEKCVNTRSINSTCSLIIRSGRGFWAYFCIACGGGGESGRADMKGQFNFLGDF